MTPLSLKQRIIFSALIVLIFFITLTAAALNKAFINSSENALKDTLTTQLYALIATAEVDIVANETQFSMPANDLETLLGLPKSGLYAQVIDKNNTVIWQSESYISADTPKATALMSGQQQFTKINLESKQFYQLSYGINWLIERSEIPLTFIINQDLNTFNKQLNKYSKTLWSWLGAMAIFLLIGQILILKWGLKPITKIVDELKKIEQGQQQKILETYPKEIEFLSSNINHLLDNEHAQKKRYRNALGDLAHSLKTPLAVLQSSLSATQQDKIMAEQIIQMNSIVEYQLQKAATAGANNLSQAIDIKHLITRIIDSLLKVYCDKGIQVSFQATDKLHFKADEGDMMELFGNLLDNAFKWSKVKITVTVLIENHTLTVNIEDDGPGFPETLIEQLKIRGQRADETTPGHGIGLSIVNNIVDSYAGTMTIKNNSTHGVSIKIKL